MTIAKRLKAHLDAEGGDHRPLISVAGADFDRLMRDARPGGF